MEMTVNLENIKPIIPATKTDEDRLMHRSGFTLMNVDVLREETTKKTKGKNKFITTQVWTRPDLNVGFERRPNGAGCKILEVTFDDGQASGI